MDMMQIRKMVMAQMAGTVSDNNHLECGQFTLAQEAKTYTINHNLGAVPDFCIVYPINVAVQESTYYFAWEFIAINLGQENWNICTNGQTFSSAHVFGAGTGYAASTPGAVADHGRQGTTYAGYATDSTIIVGGGSVNGASGRLPAGTFGYILGILNN